MEKLVSIIIPVYGVEKYLDKCMESVVRQTYKNLEIILVDDGSPDNCPKMCDDWAKRDNRVKVIHKENGGQGTARNLALDVCQGDYICFIDSDDWVEVDYVEKLLSACLENDADIAVCGIKEIQENNGKVVKCSKIKQTQIVSNPDLFNLAFRNPDFCGSEGPCNKIYKNVIFENLRFPAIKAYEDSAIFLKIFYKANKAILLPYYLYNYWIRNDSTMHYKFTRIRVDSIFEHNDIRINFLKSIGRDDLFRTEVIRFLHNCFGQYRSTKDKELRKYIKQHFKQYMKEYKQYINFWNAPFKLKIKMIIMSIF